jgi:hypothetical protein
MPTAARRAGAPFFAPQAGPRPARNDHIHMRTHCFRAWFAARSLGAAGGYCKMRRREWGFDETPVTLRAPRYSTSGTTLFPRERERNT